MQVVVQGGKILKKAVNGLLYCCTELHSVPDPAMDSLSKNTSMDKMNTSKTSTLETYHLYQTKSVLLWRLPLLLIMTLQKTLLYTRTKVLLLCRLQAQSL